jgi:hypothetical protein
MIISKFKRELNGDISEITLNTKEVLKNTKYIEPTGEGTTKLYAWKNPEGEYSANSDSFLMTATEELTDDTKVFISNGESAALLMLGTLDTSQYEISEDGITFIDGNDEYLFTRSSSDDIDLF